MRLIWILNIQVQNQPHLAKRLFVTLGHNEIDWSIILKPSPTKVRAEGALGRGWPEGPGVGTERGTAAFPHSRFPGKLSALRKKEFLKQVINKLS